MMPQHGNHQKGAATKGSVLLRFSTSFQGSADDLHYAGTARTSDDNLASMRTCILVALFFLTALNAQVPPAVAAAKTLDKEIQHLPDLPEATREKAFQEMLQRIRNEPKEYQLALAMNLAISAGEVATESTTLQEIADVLLEELKGKSGDEAESALGILADLAFYRHIHVPLDTSPYRAKLAKLESQAKTRANADFTLADTNGKSWRLKSLGGKVVLVNFWATWCPPCQREMGDFQATYNRFADQGLLILAVTREDAATVKRYLVKHPAPFDVLLDPNDVTKKEFLVNGFPHSILYNRQGNLVAQITSPLTKQQLLNTLGQAGLK